MTTAHKETDSPEQAPLLRSFEDARALGFRHRKPWERLVATPPQASSAPPPAGRGEPAGRLERATGLGRGVPKQTERGAPAPLAGETGAPIAAAPG